MEKSCERHRRKTNNARPEERPTVVGSRGRGAIKVTAAFPPVITPEAFPAVGHEMLLLREFACAGLLVTAVVTTRNDDRFC